MKKKKCKTRKAPILTDSQKNLIKKINSDTFSQENIRKRELYIDGFNPNLKI